MRSKFTARGSTDSEAVRGALTVTCAAAGAASPIERATGKDASPSQGAGTCSGVKPPGRGTAFWIWLKSLPPGCVPAQLPPAPAPRLTAVHSIQDRPVPMHAAAWATRRDASQSFWVATVVRLAAAAWLKHWAAEAQLPACSALKAACRFSRAVLEEAHSGSSDFSSDAICCCSAAVIWPAPRVSAHAFKR